MNINQLSKLSKLQRIYRSSIRISAVIVTLLKSLYLMSLGLHLGLILGLIDGLVISAILIVSVNKSDLEELEDLEE